MCAVHRDGSGTGWSDVENLDIDQPEGKDYLQLNHIAKGVRKRINKEHQAFGDTTAGGEHLPGGCRVLGITDATADLTAGAGDASYDITEGKFIGRGLIYDQTTNSLWCYTGDGTVTDDPYELMWAARSICMGDDFSTWTGNHQFDASVDFSAIEVTGPALFDDSVGIVGQLQCGSSAYFSDVNVVSLLSCSSKVAITNDCSITGVIKVDGTASQFGGSAGLGLFYDPTSYNAGQQSLTLPSGLIIKMGNAPFVGSTCDISFTTAFPNGVVSATATPIEVAGGLTAVAVDAYTQTTLTVLQSGTPYNNLYWMAIGY